MGINTKWPRLIVVGERVTEEQANEILLRTNYWRDICGNDEHWERYLIEVSGLRTGKYGLVTDESHTALVERWGLLELYYLYNARIQSSWLGGPHGWCNWDGEIGCANYNIGKWPSQSDVTEDWRMIAEAFPYLTLDAQVIEDEGEGEVGAQWHVEGGCVEIVPCDDPLRPPEALTKTVFAIGERGVSHERLGEAIKQMGQRSAS